MAYTSKLNEFFECGRRGGGVELGKAQESPVNRGIRIIGCNYYDGSMMERVLTS